MIEASPYSRLASPRETRAVLERFDLAAKHRLGQNFLVSDAVIGRILELAELDQEDVVLEVGPGIGTLTVALLPRVAAVCAIEADRTLAPVLSETCATDGEKLALVVADALKVGSAEVAAALVARGGQADKAVPTKLVSNLPYQVAATVVMRFLQEWPSLGRCVVMVQAEVADRICAEPGSRTYGAYTAKLALLGRVTGRFEVSPSSFMPVPHVDSAVVRIERTRPRDPQTGEPLAPPQIAVTTAVIDAAFAQRRKTIRNSMSASGFAKDELDRGLAAAGIDSRRRAETLAPADFVRLAAVLPSALPAAPSAIPPAVPPATLPLGGNHA